jgi:hypothetical protein
MKTSQWIVFGTHCAGKSIFLGSKKCKEITGYKWNPITDKTCVYCEDVLELGTEIINDCSLIHYCLDPEFGIFGKSKDGGVKMCEIWKSWIDTPIERKRKSIILVTTRKNILNRIKNREGNGNLFKRYSKYTPSMMIKKYEQCINFLKRENILYIIMDSSNEQYNIVDESEIETIIGL